MSVFRAKLWRADTGNRTSFHDTKLETLNRVAKLIGDGYAGEWRIRFLKEVCKSGTNAIDFTAYAIAEVGQTEAGRRMLREHLSKYLEEAVREIELKESRELIREHASKVKEDLR